MHVTIWQQWSSNHSGSFRVVGEFQTADEAGQALGVLKEQYRIAAQEQAADDAAGGKPSLWPEAIDASNLFEFLALGPDQEDRMSLLAAKRAFTWDRLLFVSSGETAVDPGAITRVLSLCGGRSNVDQEYDGNYSTIVRVKIICRAADSTTASELLREIDTYLGYLDRPHHRHQPEASIPWLAEVSVEPWRKRSRISNVDQYFFRYDHEARGTIHRDDLQLRMDLRFSAIQHGLPALIAYLERYGCSHIAYNLAEVDPSTEEAVDWDAFTYPHTFACVAGEFGAPDLARRAAEALREDENLSPRRYVWTVEQWNQLVFCLNWQAPYGYAAIVDNLATLGAATYVDVVDNHTPNQIVRVTVVCDAPNDVIASSIRRSLSSYFALADQERARQSPPWGEDVAVGADGRVMADGFRLCIELDFFQIARGLPALVQYLEQHGCGAITYHLAQVMDAEQVGPAS